MALLAVLLMSSFMSGKDKKPKSSKDGTVAIVVAARDLPFGTSVIRDYVRYAQWPADSVPEGAFTDMDTLLVDKEGKGGNRVVLRAFFSGEPVLQQKVSGFGDKATLSRKISDDMRAYSIRVNDVSGVAGFLLPGDRVDIMITRSMTGRVNDNLVTDVILQSIEILGIDQQTNESLEKPVLARTITVEVTTDQAQKLALAQQVGTLSMTLRSNANNEQEKTGRISTGDLTAGVVSQSTSTGGGNSIRVRRGMNIN
mgnify:CR=1 FL=1